MSMFHSVMTEALGCIAIWIVACLMVTAWLDTIEHKAGSWDGQTNNTSNGYVTSGSYKRSGHYRR